MDEEQEEYFLLNHIIRPKLNFKSDGSYDGFNMHEGFLENMSLLNRFKNYIDNESDVLVPVFWKGSGNLVCINKSGKSQIIEEYKYSGWSTDEIILDIIKLSEKKINNKNIGGKTKWMKEKN